MKFKISLYTTERPHLVDRLTVDACCDQHAVEQAAADPRVVAGLLYARDITVVD